MFKFIKDFVAALLNAGNNMIAPGATPVAVEKKPAAKPAKVQKPKASKLVKKGDSNKNAKPPVKTDKVAKTPKVVKKPAKPVKPVKTK